MPDNERSRRVSGGSDEATAKSLDTERVPQPTDSMPFAWVILDDEPLPPVVVRRQPLPANFEWMSWQLLDAARALARYTVDDRFPGHRRKVAERNLQNLNRAAAVLAGVLADLATDGTGVAP